MCCERCLSNSRLESIDGIQQCFLGSKVNDSFLFDVSKPAHLAGRLHLPTTMYDAEIPPPKREKLEPTGGIKLFFDLLSVDELRNVVRCLSAYPRLKNWTSYISASHLSPLCDLQNDLGFFLRLLSHGFIVGNVKPSKEKPPNLHLLSIKSDISSGELILKTQPSVHNIVIYYTDAWNPEDLLDRLSQRCRDIRSFIIINTKYRSQWCNSDINHHYLYTWRMVQYLTKDGCFERFKKLEILKLDGLVPPIHQIETNCTHLRELILRQVRLLNVAGSAVWEKLGSTLESLTLGYTAPFACEIEKIEIHCRKLRNIQIYRNDVTWNALDIDVDYSAPSTEQDDRDAEMAVSDCLISFRDQLEFAMVSDMTKDQLSRVKHACKNARFSYLSRSTINMDPMIYLDDQLEELEYRPTPNYMMEDDMELAGAINTEMEVAWTMCINLRFVKIATARPRDIEEFLRYPRANLKSLHLRLFCIDANLNHIMNLVAARTGFLEELDILIEQAGWPQSRFNGRDVEMSVGPEYAGNILGGITDSVVKKNKTSLKRFSFSSRLLGSENANKDVTQGIVGAFLNAPALEKLEVTNPGYLPDTCSPHLADFEKIVCPHRHRRLYVSVFSVPYLK